MTRNCHGVCPDRDGSSGEVGKKRPISDTESDPLKLAYFMHKWSDLTEIMGNEAGRNGRRCVVSVYPRRGEERQPIVPERLWAGRALPLCTSSPRVSLSMARWDCFQCLTQKSSAANEDVSFSASSDCGEFLLLACSALLHGPGLAMAAWLMPGPGQSDPA